MISFCWPKSVEIRNNASQAFLRAMPVTKFLKGLSQITLSLNEFRIAFDRQPELVSSAVKLLSTE